MNKERANSNTFQTSTSSSSYPKRGSIEIKSKRDSKTLTLETNGKHHTTDSVLSANSKYGASHFSKQKENKNNIKLSNSNKSKLPQIKNNLSSMPDIKHKDLD